jgi:hypothetical protein
MSGSIAKLSFKDLKKVGEEVVEKKLLELFGDPDQGRVMRTSVRRRLAKQLQAVAAGERGRPLEQVIREHGLE